MRSYAREVAFCKVYAYIMTSQYDGVFSQFDADKLTEDDVAFANNLVNSVIAENELLKLTIADFSKAYKLSRIYRIDLAVLEIAIAEMRNFDTPAPVVINEAVSIAKKFSTEKSVSFVNGILGAYLRSLS